MYNNYSTKSDLNERQLKALNRAVYTREKMAQNLRSQLSQAAAYPGLGVYTRISSSFRVLCTPRPE